jgi:hypothetical protein
MSIKLEAETRMTIDAVDMQAILTDALCNYNVLAGLAVTDVEQNDAGDFDVTLRPKPAPPAEQPA